MSFRFAYLCDYLETREELTCHDPPLAPAELKSRLFRQHATWFNCHRKAIDALDVHGTSALLSTFLPCKRKDRVYGLQSASLLKLLGRCLGLSASARQELASFRSSGNGDLGECLQRYLQARGPPPLPHVSLHELDRTLHILAAANRFSAQSVRQSFRSSMTSDSSLTDVLLRLHPTEAKWFVRLTLKDFASISSDDRSILSYVHFLLPDLLNMQDNIESACIALRTTFGAYPSRPDPQSMSLLRQNAITSLRSVPGIKIGRPEYTKARSIKHCLQMTAARKWLLERKYDGEYCQIHIDLTRGDDWLTIYSKSGRDSTEDRAGLRETLKKCLRIGSEKCKFKQHCTLVGELVVFSDNDNSILGFDRIRKHVSRAGVFLGAESNLSDHPDEHLMIVLFDLLLLDDEPVLSLSVEQRKARLSSIYKRIHGRAAPAESCVVDFSQTNAEHKLMNHFAASIACRHEGLVLKPCGVPYFANQSVAGIKLKKDYFVGLGDEADFAVVSASYDAQEAKKRSNLHLKFTHFHLGCLMNKAAAHHDGFKPIFKIVATIAYDHCMSSDVLERVNIEGSLVSEPYSKTGTTLFEIESGDMLRVDHYFRKPLVFEVLGSSYSRVPGGYFMLRHPRVKKLHHDRTWRDCITFDALQSAAAEALSVSRDSETQENLHWINKLETSHKRRHARHSLNTTPRSAASTTPQSIRSDITWTTPSERESSLRPSNILWNRAAHFEASRKQVCSTPANQNAPLPTPPDSSPSDGRMAGETCAALSKRKSNDCVDERNKRLRIQSMTGVVPAIQERQINEAELESLPRTPLADISRQASQSLVCKDTDGTVIQKSEQTEGRCKFDRAIRSNKQDSCIFSQAVVFIAGLTSAETERVRQRVVGHGAVLIHDLIHWNRDSHGYERDADTVCESQAYGGLRKVVLVDPRERRTYGACYAAIEKLGLQRVEILDYRIVDAVCADASEVAMQSDDLCQS